MELENNNHYHQDQKPVSVLQGDGYCISRILARESSVGQSSRIFYRSAEGIPFKWEMLPGTPKNPQEQDVIPPLSPSPIMQSLGLPLPNLDHDESKEPTSRIWSLKKMVKKSINLDLIRRSKQHESSRFGDSGGEFVGSAENSSFSSDASSSSFLDSSTVDGPFCCSPWNIPVILDEGSTKIYYCSQHKTAFSVEENGSFLTRILSRISTGDHFSGPLTNEIAPAGVPFRWETQPGTPKTPPEDDLIPPPSPPPAVQSLALPQPRLHVAGEMDNESAWKRAWIWIKRNYRGKKSEKMQREISFRYNEKREMCSSDEELDASFRRSASVSSLSSAAPLSKDGWRVSRIRRSVQGGCGPWSRRDILVFVRRKLKSVITS
ncbi:hypothetical protein Salat_2638200 [Sesamum alatum]|uniref:Uncharacterized protein n=1 Tax=Sesamum alatum TaxID=300844 RepID=A0AAE2CAQ1_9LAMI|nr:hypothetical protein Salat_2638200 [Sesamum alatum]